MCSLGPRPWFGWATGAVAEPGNSLAEAEQWAAGIPNLAYAIDDQTAITVVDGNVDVVSEGHWQQLQA